MASEGVKAFTHRTAGLRGNAWLMSAGLMGSSVSWKSNDCLCILSPSVASIDRLKIFISAVSRGWEMGGVEEEKGRGGHLRRSGGPNAIIRELDHK